MTAEHERLREARERGVKWRQWGPYLRDARREEVGARRLENQRHRTAGQARSERQERCEDGLAGICDDQMRLCFSVALRNDAADAQRGHVGALSRRRKEERYRCDNVPTHAYMQTRYRYPQREWAAADAAETDWLDIAIEYAKAAPGEICIQINVENHGAEAAALHVSPNLWFRSQPGCDRPPVIEPIGDCVGMTCFAARHPQMKTYYLYCEPPAGVPYIQSARAAAHYLMTVPPGRAQRIRMLLSTTAPIRRPVFVDFDETLERRRRDADEFYAALTYACTDTEQAETFRQVFSEMLWSKCVCLSEVGGWLYDLRENANRPSPRTPTLINVEVARVIATPQKRERPPLEPGASLLHTLALTCVDPDLASEQFEALLRAGVSPGALPEPAPQDTAALYAWAALLMYRLQRPRRPAEALHALQRSFPVLVAQTATGAWAAVHAQSLLEIALELAAHNPAYEERALEIYARFVTTVAVLDAVVARSDASSRRREALPPDAVRFCIGERMKFEIQSPAGLVALCAAAVFPERMLRRAPRFCDHVRWIHREHASTISRPDVLVRSVARLLEPGEHPPWATLPAGMLLIRALLQMGGLHGSSLRVQNPVMVGGKMTLFDAAAWIVEEFLRAQAPQGSRDTLTAFCEYVYMQGAVSAGHHTGWAGRITPMLCAVCEYSPVDGAGFERPVMQTCGELQAPRAAQRLATTRWT